MIETTHRDPVTKQLRSMTTGPINTCSEQAVRVVMPL